VAGFGIKDVKLSGSTTRKIVKFASYYFRVSQYHRVFIKVCL
jgi:hypothetical protein